MELANESGETTETNDEARNQRRIKLDMPDETQFAKAPPIFPRQFTSTAYHPLYTQTSSRVPDISIPLTQTATINTESQMDINQDECGKTIPDASLTIPENGTATVSYTHLRAHETLRYLVCRLLLEKKK